MNAEAKIKTVIVVGAGGVLGAAIAKEFSLTGYVVVGIRRDRTSATNSTQVNFERMHYSDFLDRQAIQQVVDHVLAEYGSIDVLIYNSAHLVMAPFLELTVDDFTTSWNASVGGAVVGAQSVLPSMLKQRQGVMIFSGATAAIRGTARFAAFSSTKFALRGLTQSLAREYQSQGIHIAHVVIDGLLHGSASVEKFGGSEESSIDPAAVAATYRMLAEQPSSAWTVEMDVRPSSERF